MFGAFPGPQDSTQNDPRSPQDGPRRSYISFFFVSFLVSIFGCFLVRFWCHLGVLLGGFWVPKSVIFGIDFRMRFQECVSMCTLGVWGRVDASWERLRAAQERPRAAKERPKSAQERPKSAQELQKSGQDPWTAKSSKIRDFELMFRMFRHTKCKSTYQPFLDNEERLNTPLSVHSRVRFFIIKLTSIKLTSIKLTRKPRKANKRYRKI